MTVECEQTVFKIGWVVATMNGVDGKNREQSPYYTLEGPPDMVK